MIYIYIFLLIICLLESKPTKFRCLFDCYEFPREPDIVVVVEVRQEVVTDAGQVTIVEGIHSLKYFNLFYG